LNRALAWFALAIGCSSSEPASAPAAAIDGGACPAIASTCPEGCTEWTARQVDPANKCVHPSAPVTCLAPSDACSGAIVCLVRATDNVAFWFPGDCHRPGWRACTEAERASTDYNSAPCAPR
jgi:hypothetical protein